VPRGCMHAVRCSSMRSVDTAAAAQSAIYTDNRQAARVVFCMALHGVAAGFCANLVGSCRVEYAAETLAVAMLLLAAFCQ
jgi:hypothetical protein